jgi:hypothetical protein
VITSVGGISVAGSARAVLGRERKQPCNSSVGFKLLCPHWIQFWEFQMQGPGIGFKTDLNVFTTHEMQLTVWLPIVVPTVQASLRSLFRRISDDDS